MTTTTTITTNTRRRRRSATGGHEARRGSTLAMLDYDTTVASHRHFYSPFSGSPRFSRPTFSLDSGWVDGFDTKSAILGGTVEEVDHNEHGHGNNYEQNDSDEDDDNDDLYYEGVDNNTRLPSLFANAAGVRRNTFGIPIINEVEHPPPSTTPPPLPPKPKPCPPGQNRHSPQLFSSSQPLDASFRLTSPIMPVTNPPPPAIQPQPKLDSVTEIALLQDNFTLLRTVLEDLQIMCTWFYAQSPVEAFTYHIDICGTIEDSVQLVLESLTRRRRLGEEEWSVRSPGWHQKYTKRMYSLNRTLFRLLSIRGTIERRKLKPHQIETVLNKLQEHQDKMADLARKFQASFDRLRLRHIHFLLTKAHSDAQQRDEARRLDEASFDRQWYEDKAIRADLRKEFFAHRTRHISVQ